MFQCEELRLLKGFSLQSDFAHQRVWIVCLSFGAILRMLIWTPAFEICPPWLPADFPTPAVLVNALASLDWLQLLYFKDYFFLVWSYFQLLSFTFQERYWIRIWKFLRYVCFSVGSSVNRAFTYFWLKGIQESTCTSAAPLPDFKQKN